MRTIAVLIFPDFQLLDAAGPIAAFEAGSRQLQPPAYRLRVIAREAGPVASSAGCRAGCRSGEP
jgi:transcriptional regulator GlxA family with amidase domain